jgi:hypothetical protein
MKLIHPSAAELRRFLLKNNFSAAVHYLCLFRLRRPSSSIFICCRDDSLSLWRNAHCLEQLESPNVRLTCQENAKHFLDRILDEHSFWEFQSRYDGVRDGFTGTFVYASKERDHTIQLSKVGSCPSLSSLIKDLEGLAND